MMIEQQYEHLIKIHGINFKSKMRRSLREKQLNLKFESSKYFVYGIGRKIEKAMLTFLLKKKPSRTI